MNKPNYVWQEETPLQAVTQKSRLRLDIQFFAEGDKIYMFGLADITIKKADGTMLKFDGKDYLQADGGELSLTPSYRELTFKDSGDTVVERRLAGWEGTVTFVIGQEDNAVLDLALSSTVPIMDSAEPAAQVGVTDARIGSILEGVEVTIHPRGLPTEDKRFDYTIYQMASTGGLTKAYDDTQTNVSVTLDMMPRKGADFSEEGNFFYRGPVDPNATT